MKREILNATLEYADNIIIVRIKEYSDVTVETMQEQYEVQSEIVGQDRYAVLVR